MKVADLSDAKLDMWAAKAEGKDVCPREHVTSRLHPEYCFAHKKAICERYSQDWSQGGPIIDKHKISIIKEYLCSEYRAGFSPTVKVHSFNDGDGYFDTEEEIVMEHEQFGETALIAAMRCFVASKFGEEIDESV